MSHTQNINILNIPKPPHEVPPFGKIYEAYCKDCPDKTLRLGQWFYNRFLKEQSGVEIDTLYNSTDFDVIFGILEKWYRDYQWPM